MEESSSPPAPPAEPGPSSTCIGPAAALAGTEGPPENPDGGHPPEEAPAGAEACCRNCGAGCGPGRDDCPKCGYILDGSSATPDGFYACPHCGRVIEMVEKNCGIFICGVDRRTHAGVNPHDEEGAARMLKAGFLVGCAKQFRLDDAAGKMVACTGQ